MSRPRPDYVDAWVAFRLAQQVARRDHDQPCDCPYCISSERIRELLQARVAAERERAGEPPF